MCRRVDELLSGEIATCDPIRMEVLAGARDERHLRDLRGLLGRAVLLPTGPGEYEEAAALYRLCRLRGETVRKLIDCLIAAHAIRTGIPLLHADGDFDVLARHTGLVVDEVTNHGEVAAVLVPPTLDPYERLVAAGKVQEARRDRKVDLRRVARAVAPVPTADILVDLRGDR